MWGLCFNERRLNSSPKGDGRGKIVEQGREAASTSVSQNLPVTRAKVTFCFESLSTRL